MNPSAGEIEALVRQVLQRLAAMERAPAEAVLGIAQTTSPMTEPAAADKHDCACHGTPKTASSSDSSCGCHGRELVLPGRVVARGELDGRLDGVERLVLKRGAVITPAARDYLREQGIELKFADSRQQGTRRSSLIAGAAETHFEPAGLFQSLAAEPIAIERVARTGLPDVVTEIAEEVRKGGKLGLVVTDLPEAAVCLANRFQGVRAFAARNAAGVERAVSAIGGNFCVLEPAGNGLFQLKQAVQVFCQGQPRNCPERWRKWLGG